MFLIHFAAALPSVIVFWGIAYLLMIKRKKIRVRNTVALAHIAATTTILALWYSPGIRMADGEWNNLIFSALVLSVCSCYVLGFQEQLYQSTKAAVARVPEHINVSAQATWTTTNDELVAAIYKSNTHPQIGINAINKILATGVNINTRNADGRTVLSIAKYYEASPNVLSLLVKAGAKE